MIASGWQASPIMTIKSAQLFSVTTGVDGVVDRPADRDAESGVWSKSICPY